MSERLIDRITKKAQIHGLLEENVEADFLREVRAKVVSLEAENNKLKKERDRCLVIATKWCDKNHHDWKEILKY